MHRLTNARMRYAWGSVDLLPTLLGDPPDGRPVAEIWMGAHPSAPSTLDVEGGAVGLDDFVAAHGAAALGAQTAARTGARLPYLFKLLAAGSPLSLQVHPTSEQAQAGFRRENSAGIALTDPARSYRDDQPKPEMLYALTEFELMCGFSPKGRIEALLTDLDLPELGPVLDALGRSATPATAIERALTVLLTASKEHQATLARAVATRARERSSRRPEYVRVVELAEHFPADVGVVAALFLNQLRLAPGETVFIGPGTMHSYVRGMGLELMGASDNVLRAGLTSKHVDVGELLRLVDFAPAAPAHLPPTPLRGAAVFAPPTGDFALWAYASPPLALPTARVPGPERGARIAVGCSGRTTLFLTNGTQRIDLTPGESAFIPDSDGPLTISATGSVALAYAPAAPAPPEPPHALSTPMMRAGQR